MGNDCHAKLEEHYKVLIQCYAGPGGRKRSAETDEVENSKLGKWVFKHSWSPCTGEYCKTMLCRAGMEKERWKTEGERNYGMIAIMHSKKSTTK